MARAPATVCGCCGRPMVKAHAVQDGVAYCMTCYAREFKPVPCASCGKTVRTVGGHGPARCKTCRVEGRVCIRCGKPTPRAGLTVEGGVACVSCARYFKPPQPCPVCGQMSLRLARDFKAGFIEPVCPSCRSKGHITCPVCRKHRRPAGLDTAGRVVCARCLADNGRSFVCPKCGREGRRHSAKRCEDCYWSDTLQRRVLDAAALIRGDWLRAAFTAFVAELAGRLGGRVAALRIDRYFLFFAKLDACCDRPSAVTPTRMVEAFGVDGLRRHAVPFGYLVKAGIIPRLSSEALELAQEQNRQMRLVETIAGVWYHDLADRYLQHLETIGERYHRRGWAGKHARFVPRTVTSNLRAALVFLKDTNRGGAGTVQQIEQTHLDRFCFEHPGYRNGIRSFVRFLNGKERLFRKLVIGTVPGGVPQDVFLSRSQYQALLAVWTEPDEDGLKEALIGLLMLLYAQPVKRLVRLRLIDLQRDRSGVFRVVFGNAEIALHERVGRLMDRYLAVRTTPTAMDDPWDNAYLFPGRTVGSHLTEAAVTYYLKKHGVTAERLFATAIHQAYLNGVRHPKVLVRAFGISTVTAIKYLNLIDPRLRDEVEARVHG